MLGSSKRAGAFIAIAAFVVAVIASATDNNAAPTPNGLQGPICQTSSIINELDRRDRFKLETLLRDAADVENSQAMLWRVEKPGKFVSHLFGTVHVIDESLNTLRPSVLQAIAQSNIVALEAEQMSRAAVRYAMVQVGPLMVTKDRPLQFLLSHDEMAFIEDAIDKAGYPKQMAVGWRPWVVNMFLTDSPCQKLKAEAGLKSLDLLVADEAKSLNTRIVGLEKMAEQYETMASIDDTAQAAWLKASIHLHDRLDDMAHTMAELYRFRRLSMVWDLTRELAPNVGLTDEVLTLIRDHLVDRRNARLTERARPLFDNGSAFVAVGALHLTGEHGMVAKLRGLGFTVTPVE